MVSVCGIFGLVSKNDKRLGPIMVQAGRNLSYRGYDSVGLATINSDGTIDLRKDVGKIEHVSDVYNFSEMSGNRGIVQLRWATFGQPSKENAQPHIDSDGDLVGAHNGNVVNNFELREKYIEEGLIVRSTNDGETCVHAVEKYVDQGNDLIKAIQLAYNDLEGDYSFVIGSVNDSCLHAIKKGSGLVIGLGDNFTCLSSDMPSILPLTRDVIHIYDNEIASLYYDRVVLRNVHDGEIIKREPKTVTESMDSVEKGGYQHFMLKEIHEQPKVASELLRLLEYSSSVDTITRALMEARNIYLIGCGTSYHACLLGSIYLSKIAKITAIPILAPQFSAQYGSSISSKDVALFLSQSGETKDVINAVHLARNKGLKIFGIANVIGSTLTQLSDADLPLACGYEISVPATKTFLNQINLFLYLAMRMSGFGEKLHYILPELITETINRTENQVDKIVNILLDCQDSYSVGYGLTYPIALEGALKIKEITYAHCEGMLSTEFKHGPLSAVTDEYPVIFVAGNDDVPIIISGINEVTCRGGIAIVIGEKDTRLESNADNLIEVPASDQFINPILSTIPLQFLSYYLSIRKGIDPDFPRNLSKTLTVD